MHTKTVAAAVAATLFSLVALAQWLGDQVAGSLKDSPLGWLDRFLGVVAGAAIGAMLAALMMLATIRLTSYRELIAEFSASRLSLPLMQQSESGCERWGRRLPAGPWLGQEFTLAARRLQGARASGSASRSQGSSR